MLQGFLKFLTGFLERSRKSVLSDDFANLPTRRWQSDRWMKVYDVGGLLRGALIDAIGASY